MDCSPPGSSIHGIFQARLLEWGAIAFSGITLLGFPTLTSIHKCSISYLSLDARKELAKRMLICLLSNIICWAWAKAQHLYIYIYVFFLGKYSFLYFWLHWILVVPCGLAPSPGIKPVSPALKGSFLTTGPPGKSPNFVFLPINCYRWFWYTERLKTENNFSKTVANTMWNRTKPNFPNSYMSAVLKLVFYKTSTLWMLFAKKFFN